MVCHENFHHKFLTLCEDTQTLVHLISMAEKPLHILCVPIMGSTSLNLINFSTIQGDWCNGPLRYLNPPGPKTALASYPGSGNTWVRYLIQHISGYITGSVYNDHSLKKMGFPGEGETNGKVIAIKTHQNS